MVFCTSLLPEHCRRLNANIFGGRYVSNLFMPFLVAFFCGWLSGTTGPSSAAVSAMSPGAALRNSPGIFRILNNSLSVPERVAFWARTFIGTPYDPDPEGAYVTSRMIVVDDQVDCMYLVFRAVELALASSPEDAVIWGYKLRINRGAELDENRRITNYDERFRYGRRMIDSGRWGREITPEIGPVKFAPGSDEAGPELAYIATADIVAGLISDNLRKGDIIYLLKDPARRIAGEIIGHMGIIDIEEGIPVLIHASGSKQTTSRPGGGMVKKIPLKEYLGRTGFTGAAFTRLDLWPK